MEEEEEEEKRARWASGAQDEGKNQKKRRGKKKRAKLLQWGEFHTNICFSLQQWRPLILATHTIRNTVAVSVPAPLT